MVRFVRLTALAVAAVLSACVSQSPLEALAALHSGDTAPPWSAPKASGSGELGDGNFKGKAVYLNFFASWCGPCNDEAPGVSRLFKKYKSKGLNVVGVDYLEDGGKATGFAQKYKWKFDIVHDDTGNVAKAFGVIALPVHIFIGKDGRVSTYRLGQMNDDEIEAAIKKITS